MTPSKPPLRPSRDSGGQASGKHQGLRQPADDERVEDALETTGLDDRGERLEDHQRDRHSKGVSGGYDDSIDRAANNEPARPDTSRAGKAQSQAAPPERKH
jgi:hypothetical protein